MGRSSSGFSAVLRLAVALLLGACLNVAVGNFEGGGEMEGGAAYGAEGGVEYSVYEGAGEAEREGEHGGEEAEREGEHGGEGEGEGEGHEEEFTPIDINASCMLLGGVVFVMALFQLVNIDDDDIRRYAWKVVSNTISIFMAVLFFQGNSEVLTHVSVKYVGVNEHILTAFHFIHCSFYVGGMLFIVANAVGAMGEEGPAPDLEEEVWVVADAMLVSYGDVVNPYTVRSVQNHDHTAKKSITWDHHGMEVAVSKIPLEQQKRERAGKMWSTLLAHMAGFAAIAAGGSMQQVEPFNSSPILVLVPILVTVGILFVFFQASQLLRAEMANSPDHHHMKRAFMAIEAIAEGENDILSLTLSFMIAQAVRFGISGQMPNAEGFEEPLRFVVEWHHVMLIGAAGMGFMFLSITVTHFRGAIVGDAATGEEGEDSLPERCCDVVVNTCAMAFAWCMFSAGRWSWLIHPVLGIHIMSIDGRILLALNLSFVCFGVVYILDQVDDGLREQSRPNKAAAKMIMSLVSAVSVLVGFSWEHSFDGAVTAIAALNPEHPVVIKFFLGVSVFFFLLRPWRKYILKRAMQLDELKHHRDRLIDRQDAAFYGMPGMLHPGAVHGPMHVRALGYGHTLPHHVATGLM